MNGHSEEITCSTHIRIDEDISFKLIDEEDEHVEREGSSGPKEGHENQVYEQRSEDKQFFGLAFKLDAFFWKVFVSNDKEI